MRYFRFSILLMLVFFVFFSESEAVTIPVGFTESVVDTGSGDPALAYCTIYKARGATSTNWQPVKRVPISAVDGGGVRSEPVNVPLASGQLPVSWRFAYTCTTVNGNEGPMLIPVTGNPITFKPDLEVVLTLTNLVSGQYENGDVEWEVICDYMLEEVSIASVQLYADGIAVGAADTESPYEGTWSTGYLNDTTNMITAMCTASDETVGSSSPKSVTIDVVAPNISDLVATSITTDEAVIDYDIFETGSGISSVSFLRCNPSPCTPSIWQSTLEKPFTITDLTRETTYDIEAQAVDRVGNVSELSNQIAVTLSEGSEEKPEFSVSSSSSLCQATIATCTFTFTQSPETDKIILMWGAEDGGTAYALSSITYAGIAMTTVSQAASPNPLIKAGIAYLDALPAPGAHSIVLTFDEAVNDIAVVVLATHGVLDGGPIDIESASSNTAKTATLNFSGIASTDLIAAVAVMDDNAADDTWAVGARQIELLDSKFGTGTPSAVISGSYAIGESLVFATASGTASRFAMVGTAWRTRAVEPVLNVALSAEPTVIESGGSSVLSWAVSGASSCTASDGWSGSKSVSGGTQSVSPTVTTTYAISCSGDTTIAQDSVTVTVNPPSDPPGGNDFFVSTTGHNANAGTLASPWRTVDFGWDQLEPGDTLHIRGGTYNECIAGDDSGTSGGGPITIRNYQSESVTISDSAGPGCTAIMQGTHLKYLTIQGLRIRDTGVASEGIRCFGACEHVRILNNTVIKENPESKGNAIFFRDRVGSGPGTLHYQGSDIEIHGNTIVYPNTGPDHTHQQELVITGGYARVKITNNTIDNHNSIGIDLVGKTAAKWKQFTGASVLPTEPTWPRQVYIKGNIVRNGGLTANDSSIYLDGARDVVIEDNQSYGNIGNGITVSAEDPAFEIRNIITRRNRVWNNSFGIRPGGITNLVANTRTAHNTLYGGKSNVRNLALGSGTDVRIKNNLSLVINTTGTHHIIHHSAQTASPVLDWNLYWLDGASNNWGYKASVYTTFTAYKNGSGQDANGILANPLLVNPGADNFQLGTGSAAIDAGEALTQTNGSGTGTAIIVDDARWFCDGYGIAGISGDNIRVGADSVTVTDINYTTNTLTVTPSITWSDNEPVSYPWLGNGPDIGWHEKQ